MSDFANYIRVAIQGLSENTPLSRASAYEKVRKTIRRQLDARSAGEAEICDTMEELENAILDLEAEQLMVPAKPASPAPAAQSEPPARPEPSAVKPAYTPESNVTPIIRKNPEPAGREPVVAASANEPTPADTAPSAPHPEVAKTPSAPEAPVGNTTNEKPQYTPQRTTAIGGSASQALKVEAGESDPLAEFQSALTAELALPITPEEEQQTKSAATPDPEPVEEPKEEQATAAPQPEPAPEPAGVLEAKSEKPEFDVKLMLLKAVSNEDMRDSATREIIYRRARNALVRYLKALSPQPDFDTVHGHIERLNQAIREVESEQSSKAVDTDAATDGADKGGFISELEDIWSADDEQPQVRKVEKPVRPAAPPMPEKFDLERTIADEVEEAVQELTVPEDDIELDFDFPEEDLVAPRSIDDEVEEAVQDLIAADTSRHQIRSKPAKKPQRPARRERVEYDDDDTDENYADHGRANPAPAEVDRWATDDSFELPEDAFDQEFAMDEPAGPVAARQVRAKDDRPRRRGGSGRMFAVLLVLLIVGVIATAFALPDMTSRYAAKAKSTAGWVVEFVAGLAGESSDSLRSATTDAGEGDAVGEPAPADEPAGTQVAETETVSETDTAEAAEAAQEETAEQPAAEPAVAAIDGEKAFLFATSGGQQPVATGNVVWSLIQSAPSPGAAAEPAIRGEITIPGEGLRATLTLRRNLDETLPASHLFELVFAPADSVSSSEISSVEGITFVQSGQDRSQPLVGSIVKIADNIFLFALADVPAARELHASLMSNPDLIEIPFVYFSGRRSTLRLVTGATGGEVFRSATEAWGEEAAVQAAAPEPAPAPAEQPAAEPELAIAPSEAPADTSAEEVPETAAVADAEPGRPIIPDNVPIPPDRPI
ncbi:hypothetical protein [Oricola indica]|uniref:hypothetical protein n=1 Tax=Oricola indica TaxID=2872591 RepID=UPI003CCC428A